MSTSVIFYRNSPVRINICCFSLDYLLYVVQYSWQLSRLHCNFLENMSECIKQSLNFEYVLWTGQTNESGFAASRKLHHSSWAENYTWKLLPQFYITMLKLAIHLTIFPRVNKSGHLEISSLVSWQKPGLILSQLPMQQKIVSNFSVCIHLLLSDVIEM